jgi:hypothetical protein
MKVKVFYAIELFLAVCFIALGLVVITNSNFFADAIQYVMVGFIVAKMIVILAKAIVFEMNKVFTVVQLVLNLTIIVLLFVFKNVDALSFVVSASCFVDLTVNILQSIFLKKSENEMLRTSFFGMENIIYIIFIVVLIFNKDSDLLATGVLFGTVILYKGLALLLDNGFIRILLNKTDFGQALRKVHGLDIVSGLLTIVILASFIFPYIEDSIPNPEDALWYCFTLITTIGTGDFVAKTRMGRILSVIIATYGIIIVAILTSAFVVYVNKIQSHKKERK